LQIGRSAHAVKEFIHSQRYNVNFVLAI